MADKLGAERTTVSDLVVSSSLLSSSVEGWDLPGFSLGMDDWFTEDPPPRKKKCLSLSRPPLQEATNRFAQPVEVSVLNEAAKGVVPLKTEQSTRWAVKNFESWAHSRSSSGVSSSVDIVPAELLRSHDSELVCKWLCCFVLETRKTDGSRYPPATLRSLVSGLNRELQRNGAPFSVLDKSDARFRSLLKTLDFQSCNLHREGIGAEKQSAKVISSEHEASFWEKNLLGYSTPKILQRTVFFYVGLNFALRGVQEQHDLVPAQLSRVPSDMGVYDASVYYEYTEFLSKNNQHRFKDINSKNKNV